MTNFEDNISLMIPAYLRGELSDVDREEIEALAADNPAIAADIEFQRNLKSALKPENNAFEPGDLGWAKLSKAMADEDIQAKPVGNKPQYFKYAAAILAVVAIGQAGLLGSQAAKKDKNSQYQTVAEAPADHHHVKVGFYPQVTEAQLTQTLQSVNAAIVAGPSALGLYKIEFKSKADCENAYKAFEMTQNVVDTVSACN